MPVKIEGMTLYDVDELAEMFGVHADSVRAMLASGKLRGRKLLRRWFVSDADLRAYFGQADLSDLSEEELRTVLSDLSAEELRAAQARTQAVLKRAREVQGKLQALQAKQEAGPKGDG